jgi:class 3 adenylate cyclase
MGSLGVHAHPPLYGDFHNPVHARAGVLGPSWRIDLVGGVSRCEYTTHAPITNLAARLMCASDDQVMVDGATMDACKITNKRAAFDAKSPIKAKGFDDPVPIFVPKLVASTGLAMKHWTAKGDPTVYFGLSPPC